MLGLEPVLNIVLMESETSLEIFLMRSWHSKKQLLSTLQELKTTRFPNTVKYVQLLRQQQIFILI